MDLCKHITLKGQFPLSLVTRTSNLKTEKSIGNNGEILLLSTNDENIITPKTFQWSIPQPPLPKQGGVHLHFPPILCLSLTFVFMIDNFLGDISFIFILYFTSYVRTWLQFLKIICLLDINLKAKMQKLKTRPFKDKTYNFMIDLGILKQEYIRVKEKLPYEFSASNCIW